MAKPENDNRKLKSSTDTIEMNGLAAVLLVESLIHALVARSVITPSDAVEIIEVAFDVIEEMAADTDHPEAMLKSIAVLGAIHKSFKIDIGDAASD